MKILAGVKQKKRDALRASISLWSTLKNMAVSKLGSQIRY
jgi:hypothetical protein